MKADESQDKQSISPTEVWDRLSSEQQAPIIRLLAQMIYKFVTTRSDMATGESSESQLRSEVIGQMEREDEKL